MKRILIILTACVFGFVALAQDVTESPVTKESNDGKQYLPQAGDFGVGIVGTPIFNYIGNMFNGTTNNSLNLGDNTLYFRYFLQDNAAIRSTVRINSNSTADKFIVIDDAAFMVDPLSNKELQDIRTMTSQGYFLTVGYQQFKGTGRFRGFYGADIGAGYSRSTTTYEYANQMTQSNPAPTTNLFGNASIRDLIDKSSPVISLGLSVFTGAEYYIMPKFCIGAEMGFT
ncbi:MAG: hypothetical protein PHE03_06500 [Bacteroidales bacterium]|nr:hypothetical protein [Bacteroidales bacterium]